MSRAKGNRFEREIARRLIEVDGSDPIAAGLAAGRVGHLDLGADIITKRFAVEAKHRQSIAGYLWTWLDHLADRVAWREHIPILVIKRDRCRPLVVLDLDYFEALLKEQNTSE